MYGCLGQVRQFLNTPEQDVLPGGILGQERQSLHRGISLRTSKIYFAATIIRNLVLLTHFNGYLD